MEELPSGTSIHSQDIVIASEVITPDRCERTSIECLDVCSCANTEARYPRDGCISQFLTSTRLTHKPIVDYSATPIGERVADTK